MWHGFYDHTRHDLQLAGAASSGGTFSDALGPVPLGYCWYVERWSAYSNSSGSTLTLELYVASDKAGPVSPDKTGRVDQTTSPKNAVGNLAAPIYVGPGNYLVAQWAGFTQNDLVRLSTQIRVHKLEIAVAQRRRQPPLEQPPAVAPDDDV
jgi:hypothetical protein